MKRLFNVFFTLFTCLSFSACGFHQAGPDPAAIRHPTAVDATATQPVAFSRLMRTEATVLSDSAQNHACQYHEYDRQGRPVRIYAPEGYLAWLSDIPHIWDFHEHSEIREVEENYEYEGNHLVRLTGCYPTELAPEDRVSYIVEFQYDGDTLTGETLRVRENEFRISCEYEDTALARVLSADGGVITFEYDSIGRLSKKTIKDDAGNTHTFIYDYKNTPVRFPDYDEGDDSAAETWIDGYEVRISCPDRLSPYSELRQYDRENRLLYAARKYDSGSEKITDFYYAKAE